MNFKKFLASIALLFIFGFTVGGCAFLKDQKASFDACMADPACKSQAQSWQSRADIAGQTITTGVATIVPGASLAIRPIGVAFGYLGLILAGILGGHALTKKASKVG